MARISVIMGIYNCASTLQEALDSLYNQTFQDFEIILCDDGSNDNTYELALDNKSKHDNIILLRNETNLGLNITLNKCLAAAKGEYIARMDGDDISLPTRFEKQVIFLDNHPEYAIVSTPMIHFDEEGEIFRGRVHEGEASKDVFNYGPPFCHAPSMVRKSAFDAVNGYNENSKFLRVEDYNLWMRMYAEGFKGYNLSEHLYMMRDDRNATNRRTFNSRINAIYAHWIAYKELDLSLFLFIRYVLSILCILIMPSFLYERLRKLKYKR